MVHVRRWVEQYETTGWFEYQEGTYVYGVDEGETFPGSWISPLGGGGILAERCGLDESTLRKWMSGSSFSITWSDADKLVTAMGDAMIWHTDPSLRAYYNRIDLQDNGHVCPHGVEVPHGDRTVDLCTQCRSKSTASVNYKRRKKERLAAAAVAA